LGFRRQKCYEIVVVDGILMDGYNRCSELKRMGDEFVDAFVAIQKK